MDLSIKSYTYYWLLYLSTTAIKQAVTDVILDWQQLIDDFVKLG